MSEGPWTKIGVIAGVVAAIAAVVGLTVHSAVTQGGRPARTSSAGSPSASRAPANSRAPAKGSGWAVHWSGPVGITSNGLNFDNTIPSSQSADIYFNGGLSSTDTAILATWPGSGTPTAAQCQTWVTTHPGSSIGTITAGMQICLKTSQGRSVLLRIDNTTPSGSPEVQAHAKVWQRGSSAGSPSASPGAAKGSRWAVYWSGPVGITSNGLNFDNRRPSSQSADIYFNGGLSSADTAILATWPGSGTPTAAQCQTWVTTHPGSSIGTITAGMQICLKTSQGRSVLLRIDNTTPSGSPEVRAHAKVWQQPH